MIEVKISKNNVFVLVALVLMLGSIVVVYAFNSNFQPNPGTPSTLGHSPDEIIVSVSGVQKSLQAAIDDGSIGGGEGGVACAAGKVAVGSMCKTVETCDAGEVLTYEGGNFICKASVIPSTVWKKVCNSKGSNGIPTAHSYTISCDAITGPYGEDLHYGLTSRTPGTPHGYCIKSGGQYIYAGSSWSGTVWFGACLENAQCTTEGDYCVMNFNSVGSSDTWFAESTIGKYCQNPDWGSAYAFEDYSTNGAIFRCVRE